MASSRQKSCNACVKSKRGCDKREPACGRCTEKRYLCIYGGQGTLSFGDSADAPISLDSLPDLASTSCGDSFMLDAGGFSDAFGASMAATSTSPNTAFRLNSAFSPTMDVAMPGGGTIDNWHLDDSGQQTQMSSAPEAKTLTRKDYSKMTNICGNYKPWQLADPSSKPAFAMGTFKNFHTKFAQDNRTSCIHHALYKDNMPRWVMSAFSMCLLYASRTDANRGLLLRVLHENVADLRETGGAATLTPTPQEKLARVHALMLYQTVRMFDGDITLGQQADDDMALLETWTAELCKVKDNLDEYVDMDKSAIRKSPPESWERWIFAESVRKTCMMGFALKAFWDLLKGRLDPTETGSWAYVHRWTLSSHLWDAPNSFDFFRAWKEKPMWIVSAFDFEDFLKTGTGDDLDEFGLYFLTIYFGVNEIKTFCYETSGRLLT